MTSITTRYSRYSVGANLTSFLSFKRSLIVKMCEPGMLAEQAPRRPPTTATIPIRKATKPPRHPAQSTAGRRTRPRAAIGSLRSFRRLWLLVRTRQVGVQPRAPLLEMGLVDLAEFRVVGHSSV